MGCDARRDTQSCRPCAKGVMQRLPGTPMRCPVQHQFDRFASKQKPAEVTGILTDADLPRASWKLKLSSAGYQRPGTAKLPARERVLALPEQQTRLASQPPVSWPPVCDSPASWQPS
jgi:hypothetical protein